MTVLEYLGRRVMLLVRAARVNIVNDSGNIQLIQMKGGEFEIRDNMPRMAEYGFSSSPPPDSDVIAIFVGGDRSNGIVIATNHQPTRFKNLQTGEAVVYNNTGQFVYLTKDGIRIEAGGKPISINGDVNITGTLTATGDVVANGKSLDHHTHGGVGSGTSHTAEPD
jgi:phage gp45-like